MSQYKGGVGSLDFPPWCKFNCNVGLLWPFLSKFFAYTEFAHSVIATLPGVARAVVELVPRAVGLHVPDEAVVVLVDLDLDGRLLLLLIVRVARQVRKRRSTCDARIYDLKIP